MKKFVLPFFLLLLSGYVSEPCLQLEQTAEFNGSPNRRPTGVDPVRVQKSVQKIKSGVALSEMEALELAAANLTYVDGKLFFNAKTEAVFNQIVVSGRIWGVSQTMSTFGTRTPVSWSRLRTFFTVGSNNHQKRSHLLVFQGEAAALFEKHPVFGPISLGQRLTGERVTPFGDLIIDEAVRNGNSLIITKAHVATENERTFARFPATTARRKMMQWRWLTEGLMTGILAATGKPFVFLALGLEDEEQGALNDISDKLAVVSLQDEDPGVVLDRM